MEMTAEPSMAPSLSYPFNIEIDADPRCARWRPFVNWLLVLPQALLLVVLGWGAGVVTFLGWFAILFTGQLPESWGNYLMAVQRFGWRVTAFEYGFTSTYPGFKVPAGYVDPGTYPAVLYSARPLTRNRLTVFFRLLLVIPHVIVLYILNLAAVVVLVVGWFAVLILGRWPVGMRTFIVNVSRWRIRVAGYLMLILDTYPPFSFQE